MGFTQVGIQNNLPVQPIHVLQIIQALTEFGATYSNTDFFRQGRTNFGAGAFTSSAHVEMHSYGGADPLQVYAGPADDIVAFKVGSDAVVTVPSLESAHALITTEDVANSTITNATILSELVTNSRIASAIITAESVTTSTITSLSASRAGITSLTASNSLLTNARVTSASGSFTGSFRGDIIGTVTNALTASTLIPGTYNITATSAVSASQANSASFAVTASYILGGGAGYPGGNANELQYNTGNGLFGGISTATFDGTVLNVTGAFQGNLVGNVTGNVTGNLTGTADTASWIRIAQTASYVRLRDGGGIIIDPNNPLAITASVRTVNGMLPVDGNVLASLSITKTGTSASFDTSGSGTITGSITDGLVWIISNDPTASRNGKVFIYNSGSVGAWYPVAPLDQAAGDARYLTLAGGTMAVSGTINMNGGNITNVPTITATSFVGTASFATSASRAVTASLALTASYIATASFATSASQAITASYIATASFAVSASRSISGSFATSASQAVSASFGYITGSLLGTASFARSASQALTASYFNTTGLLVTGSTSLTQSITGSLVVSSSFTVIGTATVASASLSGSIVTTMGDTWPSYPEATKIVTLNATEYAAILTKDVNTLYIVI